MGTPAPARMSFQFWAKWFLSFEVYLLCCTCNADSSNLFVERPSPLLLRDLFFAPEPRELIVGNFVFDPGAPEPWLLLLSLLFVVSKKEKTKKQMIIDCLFLFQKKE